MTSDPMPDDELPARLRFERIVEGPGPHIFRSVRSDAEDAEPPGPVAPPAGSDTDATILERFEALKRTLGREIEPASPAPTRPPPAEAVPPAGLPPESPAPSPADAVPALDALQARVQEARRREREIAREVPGAGIEIDEGTTTEEELEEQSEQAAATGRQARKAARRARRESRSFWKELPVLVLVALIVAFVIKTFFFQAFYIPSGSMIPTLNINDRVLVNKLSYRFGAIERGDILVFDSPEQTDTAESLISRVFRSVGEATGLVSPDDVLIKRVIGLPGETVEVRDNQVYVNGSPIAEPYLNEGTAMRDEPEITVPADEVFMMGDNRNQSNDSRRFGTISREHIVGRAFVLVWPPGAWSAL